MHGFWVASLQVWPRWALTVIRFVEKYFTFVKDPKNSGQSLVAALQSRPPLTLTINTIRDYVSMYMQLFTPLYVTSHHYDICTFVFICVTDFFSPGRDWPSLSKFPRINPDARHALPGAVFHLSKMRAHGAADARVTSGTLYL